MDILEASGVQISYGKSVILKDVDFIAPKALGTAILGRNGSGKSTFLKALSGVRKPDKGSVLLDGTSVFEKRAGQNIGFVPQNDILFDDLTVLDNLIFWGASYGVDSKNIIEKPVIKLLGLDEFLKKKPRVLSGGMRKRCSIAASVLHEPCVLILDEPFSGIDFMVRQELIEFFLGEKKAGKTLVITSHNTAELAVLCEKFCYIADQKIETAEINEGYSTEDCITNIITRRK